jgi:hypothetical protein
MGTDISSATTRYERSAELDEGTLYYRAKKCSPP